MNTGRHYDRKIDRAEQHLIDLKAEVTRYVESHPYEVLKTSEGKPKHWVHRVHFTRQPDPIIALIVADVVYNLRSGLDQLMSSMVPTDESPIFPIYFQGVWEPASESDNEQRRKDRRRWASDTKKVHAGALAILQANQPPDDAGDDDAHPLAIINRIGNKDRHTKLPVLSHMLANVNIVGLSPGGPIAGVGASRPEMLGLDANDAVQDGAELLGLPPGTVNVQIDATPVVLLSVGEMEGGYLIPEQLAWSAGLIRELIDLLRPYDLGRP
jgi:hypothetical protein